MTASDPKADLHRYLQDAREALLWKLDGLTEYDVRRPMVPTGTNLLGLVKHLASVEYNWFCLTFGRRGCAASQAAGSEPVVSGGDSITSPPEVVILHAVRPKRH